MNKTEFPSLDDSGKTMRPPRKRARLIGKVCDRLFGDLDEAVITLARVVESRAGHRPTPSLEATATEILKP